MELPEFKPFPKIPRLRREVIITEKLDGTNASVLIDDFGVLQGVSSRTRWITPGKATDNYAFAAYVNAHADIFEKLGPGHHFGEWWGVGINRGYDLAERRFSLFNTHRWNEENVPPGLYVVPVLGRTHATTEWVAAAQAAADGLALWGSTAAPGYMNPEGIVVFHLHANQMFKFTFGGDGHKGVKS